MVKTDHSEWNQTSIVARLISREALLLVGIVLVGLNLRLAVTSVSPVLGQIRTSLGLSYATVSLLTTIPTLCIGIFAFAAPRIARRLGRERAILWATILTGGATVGRLLGGYVFVLFGTTIAIGVGIGIIQTLLPELVSEYFPDRAAFATGLYTASLVGGAGLASGLTVPIETLTGSWQAALAMWAVPAAAAVLVWLPVTHETQSFSDHERENSSHGIPWRQPWAWALTLLVMVIVFMYFVELTWIVPYYTGLGWSAKRAGYLLTVSIGGQVVGALVISGLADRLHDRRPALVVLSGLSIVGLAAVALVPRLSPWLWVVIMGLGVGGASVLSLTLPIDYAPNADAAGRLSAMVIGIGYSIGAFGPFITGWLRGLFGGYRLTFLGFAGLGVLMLVLSVMLKPGRTIEA
ncbi:MFS transporter [Natrialba taiwanensis]|uniref:Cyanate transport protein cynX n=1 Tax=Natrialba taiwanensis DSM 12281 TaxID=1230458 RepID=M0A1P1_9EURY|nr:MFS transporter [Natrialba taiwanensis]ELY92246.1 Cyanate transport protein cynX [Natrialba taiwanensis DSM 12281]